MDPIIKKRLNKDIIVYPCTDKVDGDKIWGDSFILKGRFIPKYNVTITINGESLKVSSAIILTGEDIAKVHVDDEVEVTWLGRLPIQAIQAYQGLYTDCELFEVLL